MLSQLISINIRLILFCIVQNCSVMKTIRMGTSSAPARSDSQTATCPTWRFHSEIHGEPCEAASLTSQQVNEPETNRSQSSLSLRVYLWEHPRTPPC